MSSEPGIILELEKVLGDRLLSITSIGNGRYFLELEGRDAHVLAAKKLTDSGSRLITISAVDQPAFHELLYHFDIDGQVLTLRTKLWKPQMEIKSVAIHNPAAELVEQEITELFGIKFIDNPREGNLLLEDETQKNLVPLKNRPDSLENRIDKNVQTIVLHGSTTAPSRRVMKSREKLGMPENPPLCSVICPGKTMMRDIAESSGTASKHPEIRKKEADE